LGNFESLIFKGSQYYSERGLPGTDVLYSTYSTERALEKNYMSQLLYQNKTSCYLQYQFGAKFNDSFTRYSEKRSSYSTLANNTRIDNYQQNEYYLTSAFQGFPANCLALAASFDWWYNDLFSGSNIQYHASAKPTRQTALANLSAKYIQEKLTISTNILYTFTHETNATGNTAADRKRFSPTLSFSYQPLEDKNLRIRAFYKNIFRLPTFTDLYYNDFGYTKLSPEITDQYNLGVTSQQHYQGLVSVLECSLDGYYNRVTDKISIVYGMPYSSVRNIGCVEIKGADFCAKASKKISQKSDLSLNLSYTFQLAQDFSTESATYLDIIPYTPVHSGSGTLAYKFQNFECGYNYVFSGKRYIGQNSNKANQLKPYIDQNVFTRYTFQKFCCVAEVNNLLNSNYDIVKYYPMPGRNYRLSVSYTL
jgi:vitamin B12 transporter